MYLYIVCLAAATRTLYYVCRVRLQSRRGKCKRKCPHFDSRTRVPLRVRTGLRTACGWPNLRHTCTAQLCSLAVYTAQKHFHNPRAKVSSTMYYVPRTMYLVLVHRTTGICTRYSTPLVQIANKRSDEREPLSLLAQTTNRLVYIHRRATAEVHTGST